jgi:hypothetical protein
MRTDDAQVFAHGRAFRDPAIGAVSCIFREITMLRILGHSESIQDHANRPRGRAENDHSPRRRLIEPFALAGGSGSDVDRDQAGPREATIRTFDGPTPTGSRW